MDSRFRGNDGVGRPRCQTEDGMVGMGGKRTSSRGCGECHNPHEFLKHQERGRPNPHQRHRVLLVHAQAGLPRHLPQDHLGGYVNEFSRRHNARSENTLHQMAGIAYHMSGRRLPYVHPIASEDKPVPSAGRGVF